MKDIFPTYKFSKSEVRYQPITDENQYKERLSTARGTNWFWLEEDFQSYGDAYDFQ